MIPPVHGQPLSVCNAFRLPIPRTRIARISLPPDHATVTKKKTKLIRTTVSLLAGESVRATSAPGFRLVCTRSKTVAGGAPRAFSITTAYCPRTSMMRRKSPLRSIRRERHRVVFPAAVEQPELAHRQQFDMDARIALDHFKMAIHFRRSLPHGERYPAEIARFEPERLVLRPAAVLPAASSNAIAIRKLHL